MFLELKNISKLFSDNDGIDNINLEINVDYGLELFLQTNNFEAQIQHFI